MLSREGFHALRCVALYNHRLGRTGLTHQEHSLALLRDRVEKERRAHLCDGINASQTRAHSSDAIITECHSTVLYNTLNWIPGTSQVITHNFAYATIARLQ